MKGGEVKWDLIGRAQWAHFLQWHEFREKRISYIIQDYPEQYDWFLPKTAPGLTQAGLSWINQSIEAFVYCVLGVQVNVRSSILGSGGRAREAQSEFLVLMEDLIRQPDLAQSVQRYQLAVNQVKVRLNLAVAPMAWLMPANMIIDTASVVGYNNELKQAVPGMKLKHRHKKIGAEANGRGALKNKSPKQPPFKPGPRSRSRLSATKACTFYFPFR